MTAPSIKTFKSGLTAARFMTGCLLASLTFSACVTTEQRPVEPVKKPVPPEQAKAGTKDTKPVPVEPPKPELPPPPTAAEQEEFVKKQSDPDAEFGERGHDFATRLPANPAVGTLAEAAVVLGVIGGATQPLGLTTPSFEESDIGDATHAKSAGNGMSLEKMSKERGINLVDALNENAWLKSYGVARRVYQATQVTSDSEDYKKEVLAALHREATKWAKLSQEFGGAVIPPPPSADVPVAATTGTIPPPVEAPQDLPPPNPTDLRSGDAVLAEAQSLADRGNYEAAIKKANAVAPASPMYASAQEKVKDFSNLAVQDLRRKAAQSFQSAMPITDIKVRTQYLLQAKQYLEQAIKDYPAATQLPTVRDNLRVISRDLEKLQTEKG